MGPVEVVEFGAIAFLFLRELQRALPSTVKPIEVLDDLDVEPDDEPVPDSIDPGLWQIDDSVPRAMPSLVRVPKMAPVETASPPIPEVPSLLLEFQDDDGNVRHEICTHTWTEAPEVFDYGGVVYERSNGRDADHFIYKERPYDA